ncbi:transcriptional regulator, partial [Salmonella enterica subsp. enterica]|nr:transcriptional regulator [Salmonella enterica subsp. enterica]
MKTGVQFITDEKGTKKSVILSISEYERLINEADRDGDYESVPYEAG